jgi:hypothetical protein
VSRTIGVKILESAMEPTVAHYHQQGGVDESSCRAAGGRDGEYTGCSVKMSELIFYISLIFSTYF